MPSLPLRHVALGIAAFVVLCEALLRVLPVSTATRLGLYIDPRIPTYAPGIDWRYSTGWDLRRPQRLRTNGFGFVSAHEFERDPAAVALIGDSFVEAASLDAVDRPEAQLERALGRRRVFAMGSPGTALLDYAERVRFAHERFGIRDMVVLMERGDVAQVLCDSGNVRSQCLDARTLAPRTLEPPEAPALKKVLRESALAQYLASQLELTPKRLWRQAFSRVAPAAAPAAASELDPYRVDVITRTFFERIRPHVAGRLVIVVDSDRAALMRHEAIDDPLRRRFIALARAAGANVVDTEPLFRAHFERSTLSLELGPADGHFNALAVALVSAAASQALAAAEPAAQ